MEIEKFDVDNIIEAVKDVNGSTVPVDKNLLLSLLNGLKDMSNISKENIKVEELFNCEDYVIKGSKGEDIVSMARLVCMENKPKEVLVNTTELIGLYKDTRSQSRVIEQYKNTLNDLNKTLDAVRSFKSNSNPYVDKGYVKVNQLSV